MMPEPIHTGGSYGMHTTTKDGDCPPKSQLIIVVGARAEMFI